MEPLTVHILQPAEVGKRYVFPIAEAAEILGISRAHAYELAHRGDLPTLRFGRRMVVPNAGLLALLGMSLLAEE